MDDESIIRLYWDRSEQAIRESDLKYGKVCRSLSRGILGNAQDAEECVNDAWLGAWNAIPPARPGKLLPYLCRIVRNISLNRYHADRTERRGGGTCAAALEELEECLASPHMVEEELEQRELIRLIEAFLDTLSPENRVIFMRRYWFMDPYGDIAARTGLSEKNVSVRLSRIRKRLRKYLEEREVI